MRRSWTMTPSASIRRTSLLTSTLTPASASERRATSDSDWGNAGSSRGPAWRKGCPRVFTEVAVRRAGRDDEVVVGYAELIGEHLAPLSVDAGHCRQHHLGIELVAENSSYGDGNVSR